MDWGKLHLPTVPGALPPTLWADAVVNRVLVVAMLAAVLLVLRDYYLRLLQVHHSTYQHLFSTV